MMSFDEFANQLALAAKQVKPELLLAAEELGEAQKKIAQKEVIGHELPMWPPLQDTTIEEKQRLGYSGGPLLRTGAMRDSIEAEVVREAIGVSIVLGSNDAVALYQELGTATVPARPFLATAQMDSIPLAEQILGKLAATLLIPKV